jgi:cytosine/adenosine deaminase-related metal-dependent hydrolase
MSLRTLSLAARFILPVEGEPIRDGLVEIRDGRIARLGPRNGRVPDLDLGNAAITPGFVNAHTHLELGPLEGGSDPAGAGEDEIAWLRRVIEHRRRGSPERSREQVARGLKEALDAGTTLIADITTVGASWGAIAGAPIRGVVFAEVLGLQRMRALQTSQEAWEWISSIRPEEQVSACARPGLSPHAPYSTAGWLYHRAASSRLPLTTHLAEMPEESELLQRGEGRLRTFLEDLGAWDDDWSPIGPRSSDFVRRGELRQADWLIAHGTYLDPGDFWQLRPEAAPDGQRVAVAYCPRTHARFGHAPHPFRAMLERGVVVCIGTDSRASTPTLSVLDEIRFLYARDGSLNGALLLTMATLFGAWALRADTVTGSLKPGKSADLAIVALPDRDDGDPYRLLLDSDLPVTATLFEGRFVNGPPQSRPSPRQAT